MPRSVVAVELCKKYENSSSSNSPHFYFESLSLEIVVSAEYRRLRFVGLAAKRRRRRAC
jgi:hypothetical protein